MEGGFDTSKPAKPSGSSETEVAGEVKSLVEKIDKLQINNLDRVDLELTMLGFKIGTPIRVPVIKGQHNMQLTVGILQELDMSFVKGERQELYVANSKDNAQRTLNAFATGNIREQGKMSGYPESAVENYAITMEHISRQGITEEEVVNLFNESYGEVTPEIRRENFMAFLSFALSKNKWVEEIETVKLWAEAIKKFDPSLYNKMVEFYHKRRVGMI